jgi:hypothetical protein
VTRISASLGEVRLNFHQVTHGLAHGAISTHGSGRSADNKHTVWASRGAGAAPGAGNDSSQGNSGNGATDITAATISGVTAPAAAVAAAAGNSGGNGNGNGANGNGNANGHGNGNGNGNGNGHH